MVGDAKRPNEEARLATLRSLEILDTQPEPFFDRLTELTAELLDVPIALLSLVDAERQWFKARVGLAAPQTPREMGFCAWAIHETEPLIVPDATKDPRFAQSPLVLHEPKIRFYAGAPLLTEGGTVGTLCVIDRQPRTLTERERGVLQHLAGLATEALEMRQKAVAAKRQARLLAAAESLASIGHWRLDVESSTLTWSEQIYRVRGLDPAASSPSLTQAIEAYHPDDRERVAEALERAINEGEGFELTARLLRSDGALRWVRTIAVPEI